jgi:hypothetical protein
MLFSGKVIEPKLNKLAKKMTASKFTYPSIAELILFFLQCIYQIAAIVRDMQVTAVISIFF